MASDVFSLEINEYQTKLTHLNLKKNKLELLSLGLDATTPNFFSNPNDKSSSDQARIIGELYKQLNIQTNKVNVVVPDGVAYFQLMVMPNLKEVEMSRSLKLQMEELLPVPVSDVNVDFEIIKELPDNKVLILFIALQKKIADHVISTLSKAKLEPESLEIDTSAVGRMFFEFAGLIKEPSVVINFGYSTSTFYIVTPPFPYFVYCRTVKIGLQRLIKDVQANLNLDAPRVIEAVRTIGLNQNGSVNLYPILYPILTEYVNEIHKTITLSKDRYNGAIKKVYLFNYDCYVAALHSGLQNIVSLPVQSITLDPYLLPNPISKSFKNTMSSFIPVISAHIR